jgi:uncharacterized protein YndB with AHSA1/START domain
MKELVNKSIVQRHSIAAPPERVFSALTAEIGRWWTHRFRTDGVVGFEPELGGRFFEAWSGGGALYAEVTYLDPPRMLRLAGPMGMEGAVISTMVFELTAEEHGTSLLLTHDILGALSAETAEDYEAGWKALLGQTLKAYAEGQG